MTTDITLRIAGEAGQGTQTVGAIVCKMIKRLGLQVFAHQDYMSRVRGGNNYFQVRIAQVPVYAARGKCDIIVALNKESAAVHLDSLSAQGVMVVDNEKFGTGGAPPSFFNVPLHRMAKTNGGKDLFVNSVACGVLAGLMRMDFGIVEETLSAAFSLKGADLVDANVRSARAGYAFAIENFNQETFRISPAPAYAGGRLLIGGNDAISLGAIAAGCRFYSAYPMTPSTEIMETIARFSAAFGIVVEQAEDEIAAINIVIGASYAGVRAMTGTSGGGFALMAEGISLAGMTETPVVIVDGQRPSPATGLPTRTEQADLDFVIHAGHGEFCRAVFSPGCAEEAYSLTARAFDIAEKYQIPVIIMTDQHLADSLRTIDAAAFPQVHNQRHIMPKAAPGPPGGYLRYALNETGVSPRAAPSRLSGVFYVDSDEHTEEGHITEEAAVRKRMVEKRFYAKMNRLREEIVAPTVGNIDGARVLLVGFGSTFGVIKEASETMPGRAIGYLHLPQVWPFPSSHVVSAVTRAGSAKIVTVENNAGAQLAKLIRRETGITADRSILKYDGRPFDLDYLREALSKE